MSIDRTGLGEIDLPTLRHNLARLVGPEFKLPRKFMAFDLETTPPVEPPYGFIWQIGVCEVENGRPLAGQEHGKATYLKLSETVLLSNRFELDRRSKRLAETFHVSAYEAVKLAEEDYLETQKLLGVDPALGIANTVTTMRQYLKEGWPIIGQNLISFDCPFWKTECERKGVDFDFPAEGVIDVGMIIKASKLGRRIMDRETSRDFYRQVGSTRAKGVYYAIERFCMPYWDLVARYKLDVSAAHDAGYDCFMTAIILHELLADARAEEVRPLFGAG